MRRTLLVAVALLAVADAAPVHGQERRRPAARRLPAPTTTARRLQPDDLMYRGAFRLPGPSGGSNFSYSGYAMAYDPDGDPSGPDDGSPGSLYVVGHDHHQMVAEIGIPRPVITPGGDRGRLETARTLQPFADVTGGMFGELEIPRAGLAVLVGRAGRPAELHFCWGQHFQEIVPTHGRCSLRLDDPRAAGPWQLGGFTPYATADYLFPIPDDWVATHTPGQPLATGRFRDGHWSGLGPALFAYDPTNGGSPPPPGGRIDVVTPLLLYGEQQPQVPEIAASADMRMRSFAESDEWSGAAWLTAGGRSAVIFVGTKATGRNWYGFANGVEYPIDDGDPDLVYPEVPPWPHDDRGWWSEGIEAEMLFYDPAELAAVADGALATWQPQPYATMTIDDVLFDPGFDLERGKRYLVGAAAFDVERGLLYVVERMADDDEKSLIHVWQIRTAE